MTVLKVSSFVASSVLLIATATVLQSQTCTSDPQSFALQAPFLQSGRWGLQARLKNTRIDSLPHFGFGREGVHHLRGGYSADEELGSVVEDEGGSEGLSEKDRETDHESGKEEFLNEADALRELREAGDDLGEHAENDDIDEDMEETFQVSAVNPPPLPPHRKGRLTCTPQELKEIDPGLYEHLANKLGAPSEAPGSENDPVRRYALHEVLDEVRRHRKDMEGLEAADPNFFQFLASRDDGQELLDFGVSPEDPAYGMLLKYGHPDVLVRREGTPLREALHTAGAGQMVLVEEGACCAWDDVASVTQPDLNIAADPGEVLSGSWALQPPSSGSFTTTTCSVASQDAALCTVSVQSGPWHFRSCRISNGGGLAAVRCSGASRATLDGTHLAGTAAGCTHALLCSDTSAAALSFCTAANCGHAHEKGSGGIHVADSASVTATESLIANNTSTNPPNQVGLYLTGSANAELDTCKIENNANGALEASPTDSAGHPGDKSGVGLKLVGCTISGVHWAPESGRPRRLLQRKNQWIDADGFVRVR